MERPPRYTFESSVEAGPAKKGSAEAMPTPAIEVERGPEKAPDIDTRPELEPGNRPLLSAEDNPLLSPQRLEDRIRDAYTEAQVRETTEKHAEKDKSKGSARKSQPASRAPEDQPVETAPEISDSSEQPGPAAEAEPSNDTSTETLALTAEDKRLAELAPEENQQASAYLAHEGAKQARAELEQVAPDSPEATAASAAEAFNQGVLDGQTPDESYETVARTLQNETVPDETAEATQDAADDLETMSGPGQATDVEGEPVIPATTTETAETVEPVPAEDEPTSQDETDPAARDAVRDDMEADRQAPTAGETGHDGLDPPDDPPGGSGAAMGMSGLPGGGGGGGAGIGLGGVPLAATGSRAPNPADMVSKYDAMYRERQAAGRGLLVGGIIGYFWGRRRGRIRTEKKLLPIQNRLQKQVEQLHDKMTSRERDIRKLALEQAVGDKYREAANRRQLNERLRQAHQTGAESAVPLRAIEGIAAVTAAAAAAQEIVRGGQPDASRRLGRLSVERPRTPAEIRAEQARRGGSLLTAEQALAGATAVAADRLLRGANRPEQILNPAESRTIQLLGANKAVEQLSHKDVVDLAGKIEIDGVPLRRMYETSALDERGLRRIVTEYLRGGNAKEVLAREVLERELSYERDPLRRGQRGSGSTDGGGTAGGPTTAPSVGGILSATANGAGLTAEERSAQAWQARQEAVDDLRRRRTLNMSVGTILAVLAGILAYLLLF